MKIHHIGVATDDIERLAELYREFLGLEVVHREDLEQLRVWFLDVGNGYFELLEPVEPSGPIASYLESHGTGLHHVALETDDIAGAIETARELGVTPIDEEPRPGAWGTEVAFVHPNDTGGVLFEFVTT